MVQWGEPRVVDEILDDERFMAPFRSRFPSKRGRNTIPMETYLRADVPQVKLTNGPCKGLAEEVHDASVRKLTEKKVLRGRKVRVDTTVVEADIHYPTDVDLLADGVRVVTRTVKQLEKLGAETGGKFRDVGRSVKKRLLGLGRGLKQDDEEKKQSHARECDGRGADHR